MGGNVGGFERMISCKFRLKIFLAVVNLKAKTLHNYQLMAMHVESVCKCHIIIHNAGKLLCNLMGWDSFHVNT